MFLFFKKFQEAKLCVCSWQRSEFSVVIPALCFGALCQDCMEEINLFSENKLQLKQMGDRLIKASNKTRAAEIDDKLNKINDRWQHLFDVIGSR